MYHDTDPSIPHVRVIGGLSLHYGGRRMALPPGSHRLLAYLALHPAGVDRRSAAGVLWPTVDDARAAGNLRSALWRLQQVGCPLVRAEQTTLGIREVVETDLARFESWAGRVLSGSATPEDLAVDPGSIADLELLPGWYDDWVLTVRERLHLRRVHALEELSLLLRRSGRPSAAVEAVHVAVQAEPLRESGQRALIEAHQAAGNWAVARQQFDAFRRILRREIGVEPSAELTAVATAPRRRLAVPLPRQGR
ncbi:DNA-binding SARP family transcriptional activator [Blastococcus colisei]|uniref:DNA-binding SARP family transcriptional activator n=1 Tax=Blastococcus colisei TaxID=1564162 RepID=A0A543PCV6_9ACTN|nr:BTAD domain-containing putative transcriptional regulator [Blastococcus colisei]TQN41922.1 DNA-binding SARP family transcriptional activator [Blastococcus colisei]